MILLNRKGKRKSNISIINVTSVIIDVIKRNFLFIAVIAILFFVVGCVGSSNVLGLIKNTSEAQMIGMPFNQVEKQYGQVSDVRVENDIVFFTFDKSSVSFAFNGVTYKEAKEMLNSNSSIDNRNQRLSDCECTLVQGSAKEFKLGDRNYEQITEMLGNDLLVQSPCEQYVYKLIDSNDSFDYFVLSNNELSFTSEDIIRIVKADVHSWNPPTCLEPSICVYCYGTKGNAIGHKWGEWETEKDATCTTDGSQIRVCLNDSLHFETQVIPAVGHKWSDWQWEKEATCTNEGVMYRVCANDDSHIETQTVPAIGHEWIDETYDQPMMCTRCGQEKGHKKGYVGDLLGSFSEEKVYRGTQWTNPFVLANRIDNCMGLTMTITFSEYSGYAWDKWVLFARNTDGKWIQVGAFNVSKEALEAHTPIVIEFTFDPYVSFDALMWQKASSNQYSANWDAVFTEAQQYIG